MTSTHDDPNRLRKLYHSKKSSARSNGVGFHFDDREDFVNWWQMQAAQCAYCETPISIIKNLIEHKRLHARKVSGQGLRGLVLELDRKDPGGPYSKQNCALACYYCNNDKSYIYSAEAYLKYFGQNRKKHFEALAAELDLEA